MAPAGYFLLPLQNKTDVPEGQGHRTAKTNKTTNEFKDKPISKRYARGGRKSRWRVCVCTDGAGSTLQSLVTSVG